MLLVLILLGLIKHGISQPYLFPVSIIHINDFHARFEETDLSSSTCSNTGQCIGGYARLVTVVKELLEKHKDTNPIYLNAGDNFQGTIWYNTGGWNVTQHFLNLLPADAMTIGNHEFDNGIDGITPFLERIKSPVVVTNIDDSQEPTMQGKYRKSIIINKYKRKIGIIGVISEKTYELANTGKLQFLNESETVRAEAEHLKNTENVDIIIVLSHCAVEVDKIIAKNVGPLIDVIVGGHSHTFMYTGENPPGPDVPRDEYPVQIIQDNGHKVLIVQASCYSKYVGDITVYFDANGEVAHYEGSPVFVDSNIIPDAEIVKELEPWKEVIDATGKREVGISRVTLSISTCNFAECNIGSFINDAFVHAYAKLMNSGQSWTTAAVSVYNSGGIRATLNKGVLTYSHLIATLPFANTLDSFDLKGKYILDALEYSVSESYDEETFIPARMLQVSGLRITFDFTNPVGKRVVNALIRCQNCTIPTFEPIDLEASYRIITVSFLTNGGGGFTMFRDYKRNLVHGPIDIDAFTKYVEMQSPIAAASDGRITVLK